MSRDRRHGKRHPIEIVPPEQMVPAEPSANGHAPAPPADDYWARASGKAAKRVAPSPADVERPAATPAPALPERNEPAGDAAASYWDRARGAAPRHPSLPERSQVPPRAAAASVAPEALQAPQVTTGDTTIPSLAPVTLMPAAVPIENLAIGEPVSTIRGAHVGKEDPLAFEVRGAHIKADDPLAGAAWEAQLIEEDALADAVSGAHVKADDPLAASFSPAHASKSDDVVEPSETEAAEAAAEGVRAKTRRRWGIVPVAGAAAALVSGLGGGAAFAYFTSHGSGTGSVTAGTLSTITLNAVAGTPSTPLLPGSSGDVLLNITNPNGALTLVSTSANGPITISPSGCTVANSGVTFNAQSNLSINVPSGTSNVDLPGAISLGSGASSACQGATFTVPITVTVHQG